MRNAERRRRSRFPFDVDCVAEFSRVYREVTLRNVSMHGALIEAQNLAVHFDGPDCTIRIRSANERTLELPATVTRGNARNLVALRWAQAGKHSQKELRRLIWTNIGADHFSASGLKSRLAAARSPIGLAALRMIRDRSSR